jgi:hypothetical protein
MGVMFALGGSLMANSMQRPGARVIHNRMRRLLPALWVFGALLLTAMIAYAIGAQTTGELPSPGSLLAWIIPVVDPTGTDWMLPATEVLWYLVTYLWFVMLSPMVVRAYRRWPWPTILTPLAVLAVVVLAGMDLSSPTGSVVLNVATFGSCWLVGFAHRDGRLVAMKLPVLVATAAVFLVAGALWAFTHATEWAGVDLNEIPLAEGLYSFGFVLLAMRLRPGMQWLRARPVLNWSVSAVNARAVTIYLWHNMMITASYPIGDALDVWRFGELAGGVMCLGIALVLIAVVAAVVGFVEDLGARRPPRMVPPA